MLIPSQNRKKIYQLLFQEGVMVAKKDFNAPAHMELADVPNLQVIKALQSMTSRGFVTTRFSWQYYYYYLTNEGIEYLRGVLGLPIEIVPRTLIKTKSEARQERPARDERPRTGRSDGDYKRRGVEGEGKKEAAAPSGDFRPQFRGGLGAQ